MQPPSAEPSSSLASLVVSGKSVPPLPSRALPSRRQATASAIAPAVDSPPANRTSLLTALRVRGLPTAPRQAWPSVDCWRSPPSGPCPPCCESTQPSTDSPCDFPENLVLLLGRWWELELLETVLPYPAEARLALSPARPWPYGASPSHQESVSLSGAHSSRVHGPEATHPGSRHHCPSVGALDESRSSALCRSACRTESRTGRGSRELVPGWLTCKQAQANTGKAVHP